MSRFFVTACCAAAAVTSTALGFTIDRDTNTNNKPHASHTFAEIDGSSAKGAQGIVIGSVQFTSLSGATPQQTIAANANKILNISLNAVNTLPIPSNNSTGLIELLAFPEFSLFGPTFQLSASCPTAANANPSKADLLGPYCETIPQSAVGQMVNCDDADAATTPYKIIACGLMENTFANPSTELLAVSYNTCQRGEGGNASAPPSFFNTQVVVGGGRLLALYKKTHPFYTSCFDTPQMELVTFNTLLTNTTFGLFTCFDIVFPTPKENLVKAGVTHFSYSAAIPIVFRALVELFSATNGGVVVAASNLNGLSSVVAGGKTVDDFSGSAGCSMDVGDVPCVTVAVVPAVV